MENIFPFWNIQINLMENWKFPEAYYNILGYYWKGMWWLLYFFFFLFCFHWNIFDLYCVYMYIYIYTHIYTQWLPRWYNGTRSTCQCRRHRSCGFDPWVGKIPWSRKWQTGPVFLPGQFHRQRSLVGYSPWGYKESDVTEPLSTWIHIYIYIHIYTYLYTYIYVGIYILFQILFHYKLLYWRQLPVLCSMSLLSICFVYSSMYLLIPKY